MTNETYFLACLLDIGPPDYLSSCSDAHPEPLFMVAPATYLDTTRSWFDRNIQPETQHEWLYFWVSYKKWLRANCR